jgi:hypothetical protein
VSTREHDMRQFVQRAERWRHSVSPVSCHVKRKKGETRNFVGISSGHPDSLQILALRIFKLSSDQVILVHQSVGGRV